ncbi:MAG: LysM peptidoglycan-binding domain-containing protein [Chthoniobacteraceae bacterium]
MIKALVILVLAAVVFGTGGYFAYVLFVRPDLMLERDKAQKASLPAATPTPDTSLPIYEKAVALQKDGKLPDAQQVLENFLTNYPASPKVQEATQLLGQVNAEEFFTPGPGPNKIGYTVQRGDAIAKIERKLRTSADLIMLTNRLADPTRLQVGQHLWVPQADFVVKIKRPEQVVVLFNHGHFFRQYQPLSWQVPKTKLSSPNAKVTEKVAWKEGARVSFGSEQYNGSLRWIVMSQPGFTLFSDSKDPAIKVERPNGGIGLRPEDADQISALVNRNTPVIID